MENQLENLKQYTTVVADTGDFESIRDLQPTDATTNPSLILKAVKQARYQPLLEDLLRQHPDASTEAIADLLLVRFGQKILDIVPGRVSTEVDARLSFDSAATIAKARHLIALYEQAGIDKSRVLIKIAATWEGIEAAAQLQQEGINCNLTLLFCLTQAIACAQAKVKLISPFVGRIYDWHKKQAGQQWDEQAHAGIHDPGVKSVTSIYRYYKQHQINTEIMGASFRNIGQIRALAGCDLLTISPELLKQLANSHEPLEPVLRLDPEHEVKAAETLTQAQFRFDLNEDAMATEKLAEGIRVFVADAYQLDNTIETLRQR
ncbi:transaldolase [Brackiella oedipodis]|uniref:transaldolase n=1 Tax=Brackiella oedipodis TaxID=124225 RepID=UPI000490CA6A|nr:transaldolase [Brackiella oedipodis]